MFAVTSGIHRREGLGRRCARPQRDLFPSRTPSWRINQTAHAPSSHSASSGKICVMRPLDTHWVSSSDTHLRQTMLWSKPLAGRRSTPRGSSSKCGLNRDARGEDRKIKPASWGCWTMTAAYVTLFSVVPLFFYSPYLDRHLSYTGVGWVGYIVLNGRGGKWVGGGGDVWRALSI